MKTARSIVVVALSAALAACAHEGAKGSPQTQASASSSCPLARLAGVDATVADIHDGVAVTFTGPESIASPLRANVRAMADAQSSAGDAFAICPCASSFSEQYGGSTEPMPGTGETGLTHENQSGSGPNGPPQSSGSYAVGQPAIAATASVEDTATGAVLMLKATDSGQTQALRDRVRLDVRGLETTCVQSQQ